MRIRDRSVLGTNLLAGEDAVLQTYVYLCSELASKRLPIDHTLQRPRGIPFQRLHGDEERHRHPAFDTGWCRFEEGLVAYAVREAKFREGLMPAQSPLMPRMAVVSTPTFHS